MTYHDGKPEQRSESGTIPDAGLLYIDRFLLAGDAQTHTLGDIIESPVQISSLPFLRS
jgi:hypothetical protein